ncbi:MAG: DUF5703 domain-containing protein [Prevotellaceae bacterium]|jgi:hypothetical protein|nr:DUF5703 domain-containing protein [Prevotellaceae bacterium]
MKKIFLFLYLIVAVSTSVWAQIKPDVGMYNVVWDVPSRNSSESMPCGGGDIGLNVWVEKGDILFYISRSGTFDENNEMLKLGRVRLSLSRDISGGNDFRQTLQLDKGCVSITGNGLEALIWVDVFRPIIHVEVSGTKACALKASYENWRFDDYVPIPRQLFSTSFKHPHKDYKVMTRKDVVETSPDMIVFYHRNREDIDDIFDLTVRQQGLEAVKSEMYNPIRTLTFGGYMRGDNLQYKSIADGKYADTPFRAWLMESKKNSRRHTLEIGLHVEQTPTLDEWKAGLTEISRSAVASRKIARKNTLDWWKQFWSRSFIFIDGAPNDEHWQIARNHTLFRYQLGCNAYGKLPTKFNGGLFTFDPVFVDSTNHATPDYRSWGGGTMTAQNQRLVYWHMLKGGDFDMMKPQFDFYLRALKNAELRSRVYWGHNGACFTEQIEQFGLPELFEYGCDRPKDYHLGLQYNSWLEYLWDTVFEFCMMIIETERYANRNITEYIPLIESCLSFFDEHYRLMAQQRGIKIWDGQGRYVFYPSSACETYKMSYNPSTVIAALQVVLSRLLELPDSYLTSDSRARWLEMLKRIPPLPFREIEGRKMLAPAETWQYINNQEAPQLYPVFPWGLYGVGKPDIQTAINTYLYDEQVVKNKNILSWKQYPIWAARLGMTAEADSLIRLKLRDANRRFPTWWGPGYDWVPDHNWGGSGMIALQEMLMQTVGEKIYLLPACPKNWNINFKLNAPYQTTVEATVKNGKIISLKVSPEARRKDIIIIGQDINIDN